MKKIMFSIITLLICVNINWAQTVSEKKIKSEIKNVTVYLDGAQVTCTHSVQLSKGRNMVILNAFSPHVPAENIRIKTSGDVSVLQISTENYKETDKKIAQQVKEKKDSIKALQQLTSSLTDEKDAYIYLYGGRYMPCAGGFGRHRRGEKGACHW